MKCMERLRGKLFGARRDLFSEAIIATDEATVATRSLREQLEPYSLESDPFAAMLSKHIVAEVLGDGLRRLEE